MHCAFSAHKQSYSVDFLYLFKVFLGEFSFIQRRADRKWEETDGERHATKVHSWNQTGDAAITVCASVAMMPQ